MVTDSRPSDSKIAVGTAPVISDVTISSTQSAGTIVTQDLLHKNKHDPLMSKTEQRKIKMKDMVDMMKASTRDFSEVTTEQIERVKKRHDQFSEGAEFNFNYNVLLLVASVLAGLGLVSNSSTTVIASMLVSPIMGPVVAVAYGKTISDRKLVRQALKVELLSIVFCVFIGGLIGTATGWTDLISSWPTKEMRSRASFQNFLIGLPVAFFSGLGVAVSLLDEQTNSLVGVAISASLLPPAVNAGIIWVAYGWYERAIALDLDVETFERWGTRSEFRDAGSATLFLTVANIILVIAASMLMFRMKEFTFGNSAFLLRKRSFGRIWGLPERSTRIGL